MAEQHRATLLQWREAKEHKYHITFSCLLELRDRIKELENAQPPQPNHPAKPDSSLKGRVEHAIYTSGNEPGFRAEARAAILEVAAWLREHFPHGAGGWAMRLKREAER